MRRSCWRSRWRIRARCRTWIRRRITRRQAGRLLRHIQIDSIHWSRHGRTPMNEPITIHHLDDATAEWIEEQAAQRGLDKGAVVLQLIQQGVNLEQRKADLPKYHDLDYLAGTWSKE